MAQQPKLWQGPGQTVHNLFGPGTGHCPPSSTQVQYQHKTEREVGGFLAYGFRSQAKSGSKSVGQNGKATIQPFN